MKMFWIIAALFLLAAIAVHYEPEKITVGGDRFAGPAWTEEKQSRVPVESWKTPTSDQWTGGTGYSGVTSVTTNTVCTTAPMSGTGSALILACAGKP